MTRADTVVATSLGPPLVFADGCWCLAADELPVVHGLSVLSRALADMVASELRAGAGDIAIERGLRPRENPELIERFGLDGVHLRVARSLAQHIATAPDGFETRLRAMLGSLQRQQFRDALLPADRAATRALVGDFGTGGDACRIVLEYVPAAGDPDRGPARGVLRFTIDAATGDRLPRLAGLPHVTIEDLGERQFLAGSTRIAMTWTEALRREAERGRRSFVERRVPHSHLFRQLEQAGLGALSSVALHWSDDATPLLFESEPAVVAELLKRVLLALEDRSVRRLLGERATLRIETGVLPVFVDTAQLGRVLAISLGQRRERADADAFLARMPALRAVVAANARSPLRDVPVFLVHHMTSEVVGLIAALRALGCRDLCCLFVTYAGEPPASYLDAILDLPSEEFTALALVQVPARDRVGGHYRLSSHYSELAERDDVAAALAGRDHDYLEAMRAAAVVPFLRQLARAEAAGRRCLLIEDGGYLAPVLHDAVLRGATVGAFAAELGHRTAGDDRPFADVVRARLAGTVEHTRNGFDRLVEVERRHGRLALPAFSIAVSWLKRRVESREVAASVLGAVEAVLNADGRTLARRTCLVLGSRGAIGRELCSALAHRLDRGATFGVDLAAGDGAGPAACTEARTLAGLPPGAWPEVDLVIGVTGRCALTGADVERWLLDSPHPSLVLASGSTKTVEFAEPMRWCDGLLRHDAPRLGDAPVRIRVEELLDPRTARVYGHRWCFEFGDGRAPKAVLALGGLAPINFLFYGVANEIIDDVLAQLLSASLGLLRRSAAGELEPRLFAVDRDVDAEGRPLGDAHGVR